MFSVIMPATLSNYMLSSVIREALQKTRSSFLPQSTITGKHSRSVFGRVHVVLVAFLISIFILVRTGLYAAIVWEALFILFGLLFILVGWLEFSLLQEIEIIPTSKIEAAAEGVNEINAQFVPEKGDCLTSPLTKQKCVFYIVSLQELVSSGKSSHWEQRAYYDDGIPSLMTDGTGYLAMDLESADMSLKGADYYPVNGKNQLVRSGTPEGENLLTAVETGGSKTDLSKLGIAFSTNPNVGVSFSLFSGYEMKLVEIVIPTGTDYFVMGRINGTESELKGKPVKFMTYDSHTKILTVRNESKGSIELHDKLLSFFSLGLGFLVLLAGVGLFAITSANPTHLQAMLTTTINTAAYTTAPTTVYRPLATYSTIQYNINNLFQVSVTASDPHDSLLRDWHLFIDVYPGKYTGYGNEYSNASTYTYYGDSGSTMTYSSYNFNSTNDPGTHTLYFVIGQSGGSSYGTYSGTVQIDNYSVQFNSIDACYALAVTYNLNHGGILDSSFVYLC